MQASSTGMGPVHVAGQARNDFRPLGTIMVLNVMSLALQLAGFVTPGWQVIKSPMSSISYGLWYVRTCLGDECTVTTLEKEDLEKAFKPYRIEACIALASIIVAVFISIRHRRMQVVQFCDVISTYMWIGFWCTISGIVSLSSAGRMADALVEAVKDESTNNVVIKFPYSLLLTGLGGIAACLVELMSIRYMYQLLKQNGANGVAGAYTVEMSGTPALAVVPQTGVAYPPSFPTAPAQHMFQHSYDNAGYTQGAPPAYPSYTGSADTLQTQPQNLT